MIPKHFLSGTYYISQKCEKIKKFKGKQYDEAKMTETKDILLISFIVCVLLYNYIGACISRKHGAKIPLWPGIIKSCTFYLIYIGYMALLLNGIAQYLKKVTHSRLRYLVLLSCFFLFSLLKLSGIKQKTA
jgi:hypothetical protein